MIKKLTYLLVFLIGSLSFPEQAMACEEQHTAKHEQPVSCEQQSSMEDCCRHQHEAGQEDSGMKKCSSEHCLGLCHSTISLFFQWSHTVIPQKISVFTKGNAMYFYPIYQQPNGNIWTPPQVN